MNPWIAQAASGARIHDLQHDADIDRIARQVRVDRRRNHEHAAMTRVAGEILLRAGRRLAG
ncbi:MAG: hypothetical protein ABSA40_02590 [Candidatus Dormibacteria bacterium]|jgi:hypothetical protein